MRTRIALLSLFILALSACGSSGDLYEQSSRGGSGGVGDGGYTSDVRAEGEVDTPSELDSHDRDGRQASDGVDIESYRASADVIVESFPYVIDSDTEPGLYLFSHDGELAYVFDAAGTATELEAVTFGDGATRTVPVEDGAASVEQGTFAVSFESFEGEALFEVTAN